MKSTTIIHSPLFLKLGNRLENWAGLQSVRHLSPRSCAFEMCVCVRVCLDMETPHHACCQISNRNINQFSAVFSPLILLSDNNNTLRKRKRINNFTTKWGQIRVPCIFLNYKIIKMTWVRSRANLAIE